MNESDKLLTWGLLCLILAAVGSPKALWYVTAWILLILSIYKEWKDE